MCGRHLGEYRTDIAVSVNRSVLVVQVSKTKLCRLVTMRIDQLL